MRLRAAITCTRKSGAEPDHSSRFDAFVGGEVLSAVDRLPHPFRDVVVPSDLEDMGQPEVSRGARHPRRYGDSRIVRGRRLLPEALYAYAMER